MESTQLQPLDIDELPEYSPWPPRLLEIEPWESDGTYTDPTKYNERYGAHLAFQRQHPALDFRDVADWRGRATSEGSTAISKREALYLTDHATAQSLQEEALVSAFEGILDGGELVVSLGCGWGYNLGVLAEAYPTCTFLGGEIAENAVTLGQNVFEDTDTVSIEQFDFHDSQWDLLEREVDRDIVLFTRGALTTLSNLQKAFITSLQDYLPTLREGVHLEPVHELHSEETLLGLLRRKYTHARGYNPGILTALNTIEDIEITATTYDVMGRNPLHPLSEIHWKAR